MWLSFDLMRDAFVASATAPFSSSGPHCVHGSSAPVPAPPTPAPSAAATLPAVEATTSAAPASSSSPPVDALLCGGSSIGGGDGGAAAAPAAPLPAPSPTAAASSATGRITSFKLLRLTESSAVGAAWKAARDVSVSLPIDHAKLTEVLFAWPPV